MEMKSMRGKESESKNGETRGPFLHFHFNKHVLHTKKFTGGSGGKKGSLRSVNQKLETELYLQLVLTLMIRLIS